MNADGSEQHMVSPELGANTWSYFSMGKDRIIFAATFGVVDSCPPRLKPQGNRYLFLRRSGMTDSVPYQARIRILAWYGMVFT